MSWWKNSPGATLFDSEDYLVPRYPRHVARAFISVNFDDRDPFMEEREWRPFPEVLEEAIQAFAQCWGGLDDAAFLRALREGRGRDKLVAIFAIGHSQLAFASEILVPFLASADLLERFAAACCLGLKKDERALPVLKDYLLTPEPTTTESGMVRVVREAEGWYSLYRALLVRVLATWGPASMAPILQKAFQHVWGRQEKDGPGIHWTDDYLYFALCYALGRRGAVGALLGLKLSVSQRRLAMMYLTLGYLRADERFSDLDQEMVVNRVLQREVASVLAEHFALSEEECQEVLNNWWDDADSWRHWYKDLEGGEEILEGE